MKTKLSLLVTIATFSTTALCAEETTNAGSALVATATITPGTKATTAHGYHEVDTTGAKELINSEKNLVIIDARTPEYDDGTRIPNAVFLPYDSANEQIAIAIPTKETTVLIYCTSTKCPASKYLADKLVKLGYTHVVKYNDGIEAWIAGGNKIDQKEKSK